MQKKEVILVDHNEKTQAVDGIDEASILEIIDHHRLGSGIETVGPVYFVINRWVVQRRSYTKCTVKMEWRLIKQLRLYFVQPLHLIH